MRKGHTKTSISLDPEILEGAKLRVEETGQSVSSYINVLIRRDLNLIGTRTAKSAPAKPVRKAALAPQ